MLTLLFASPLRPCISRPAPAATRALFKSAVLVNSQVFAGTLFGTQPVAIKVLHSVSNVVLKRQFWQEVAILQRCRHPNIVQMLGVYSGPADPSSSNPSSDLQLMVVIELMEGGTLREHITRSDMRWSERYAICCVQSD